MKNNCNNCAHNGQQAVYPGSCTGCGPDGTALNFKQSSKTDTDNAYLKMFNDFPDFLKKSEQSFTGSSK